MSEYVKLEVRLQSHSWCAIPVYVRLKPHLRFCHYSPMKILFFCHSEVASASEESQDFGNKRDISLRSI